MRPNGEVRWVHRRGRVRRGPHGQARSVLGVALDITERKQAEEANARLASLVSAADDAIIGMALDGTILSWNPAAERLFGYPADEMIGQSARILYPGGRRRRVRPRCMRACAPASTCATKACACGATARRSHVSVVVTPVLGQDRRRRRRLGHRARHHRAQAHRAAAGRHAGAADADQQPAQDGAGSRRHGHLRGRHRARPHHLVRRDLRPGRRRAHARARCRPRTSSASSIPTICQRHARAGPRRSRRRRLRERVPHHSSGRRGALDLRARPGLAEPATSRPGRTA